MVIRLVLNSAASANWSGSGALAGYCWLMMRFFYFPRDLQILRRHFPVLIHSVSGWRAGYTI
ncbi:hypothetical protein C210_08735 [Klebsiella pneumoniae subsp. pneumoniae KpMDU1]|nr:hypothetical protein C210_08735 [Klebsiella pneumoniae subsp. pneumoniae KpMDU1]CDL45999.1 hypothetical protein [Klebsiella pneumoniae ISC21]CDL62711.1 hypothetical protein [Klebsiella pneumoniae IS39]